MINSSNSNATKFHVLYMNTFSYNDALFKNHRISLSLAFEGLAYNFKSELFGVARFLTAGQGNGDTSYEGGPWELRSYWQLHC